MSEKHPAHRHKAISKNEKEEDYFLKKDAELIRRLRERHDAERRELERKRHREAHWMRCPKCGAEMREMEIQSVKLDECPECKGIFCDAGEFEILIKMKDQSRLWECLLGKRGG